MTRQNLLVLVAELTHRCPLRCAYCSNPLQLTEIAAELPAESWARVFSQAVDLGVLQIHLTGGEPLIRHDLLQIVETATGTGAYVTLVTSGLVGRRRVSRERLFELVNAGLRAVQVSFQDTDGRRGKEVAGLDAASEKLEFCKEVIASGASLTTNFVLHRMNVERMEEFVDVSLELGADRIELAHTQYHGWALANQATLQPSIEQIDRANALAKKLKLRHSARAELVYVMPDMFSDRAKACMGGWGRHAMVIDPSGLALPCHAAKSLPLQFDDVRHKTLADIWNDGNVFNAFRGQSWMKEPCSSCPDRERDHGGCRCQALALTGDASATDPACFRSPLHDLVRSKRRTQRPASERSTLRLRTMSRAALDG